MGSLERLPGGRGIWSGHCCRINTHVGTDVTQEKEKVMGSSQQTSSPSRGGIHTDPGSPLPLHRAPLPAFTAELPCKCLHCSPLHLSLSPGAPHPKPVPPNIHTHTLYPPSHLGACSPDPSVCVQTHPHTRQPCAHASSSPALRYWNWAVEYSASNPAPA